MSRPGPRDSGYLLDTVCREVPAPGRSPLYLGNGESTASESYGPDGDPDEGPSDPSAFSHVISLNAEPYDLVTDHHPLTDGPGNSDEAFDAAVDAARRAYRAEQGPVLINCAAGVSRSTTVMATVLAAENPTTFTFASAVEHIRERRPPVNPADALKRHARRYLNHHAPSAVEEGRDPGGEDGGTEGSA
ncbi:MAG: hypothetical protein ACI9CA_000011 [Natronomonas sp.]|jgi:hypothetical protein